MIFPTSKLKFWKNVNISIIFWDSNLKCRTYIYEKSKNCNSRGVLYSLVHSKTFLQTDNVHLQKMAWIE